MSTFGPGDYGGYNDRGFSGVNTFWTNWNTSTFATGILGRVTAIAARWDYYTISCSSATGHNTIWDTSNNKVQGTGTFSVNGTGDTFNDTMNNASCGDVWQNNASYYIGFSRDSSKCSHFSWKDNTNGGYAGKSAGDSTNSGGTANWVGTTNGGLPVYGTVTVTNIFVRRSGAWTRTFVYVRRSGAWTGPVFVYVRRSGAWTLLNELKEHEVPKNGEEALVDVGEGLERGWITEDGEKSWFGSEDPTTQDFDWSVPGQHEWEWKPWTGKYSSFDSEEIAWDRLGAQWKWDQALRQENYAEADKWFKKFQPNVPIIHKKEIFESVDVPKSDPEPILLGCNCGG